VEEQHDTDCQCAHSVDVGAIRNPWIPEVWRHLAQPTRHDPVSTKKAATDHRAAAPTRFEAPRMASGISLSACAQAKSSVIEFANFRINRSRKSMAARESVPGKRC
jgi:hypothetical protein